MELLAKKQNVSSRFRSAPRKLLETPFSCRKRADATVTCVSNAHGLVLAPFLGLHCVRLANRIRRGVFEGRKGRGYR